MSELQTISRGNRPDYVLGTELGWDAFEVVRFAGREGLNELFEYDILLSRSAELPPVDIDPLVDSGATLRIATEARWRGVHGIVAEAVVVDQTSTVVLYRMVLVPHLWRADLRRRCRTFVDKSVRDVVSAVLENTASGGTSGRGLARLTEAPTPPPREPSFESFSVPAGSYRWAVADPARIEQSRAFLVQYNESDLNFVRRLLAAEGISFFFEHAAEGAVLTLSDRPGHAPLFERDASYELVGGSGGAARDQEIVRSHRRASRLRAGSVVMRDYRWRASDTLLQAREQGQGASELEHFEFPAADEDSAEPGRAPARFQMERFAAEAALTQGYGTVRTHEPGYRFTLVDRAGLRDDAVLLVTRTETHAVQLLPDDTQLDLEPLGLAREASKDEPFFEVRYHGLPARLTFRPKRETQKNTIAGVQSARVSAEEVGEGTELNSDKFGRVRIRFPWDQRPSDGTPSSKWVRVAQYWAGPGFGALYVPRVGHEVLVAFERGDPDRPIIVGRVYNELNPPPYAEPNTTISTIKSESVGQDGSDAEGFNEFRFEDAAAKEQVFLHAQRNLDEVVRASHTTTVGGDQANTVGGNQSNTVFGDREHNVSGTELVHVAGNRTTNFDASEFHQVGADRITGIGANDIHGINAHHSITVGAGQAFTISGGQKYVISGGQDYTVTGDRSLSVSAAHTITVGADESLMVGGTRSVNVAGAHSHSAPSHAFVSAGAFSSAAAEHTFVCSKFSISAGGATLTMAGGMIMLDNGAGASISLVGGAILVNSANYICGTGGTRQLSSGGSTIIASGGPIVEGAPLIKLN